MEHAFRISPIAVRRMRQSLWFVPVVAGCIAAFVSFGDDTGNLLVGIAVVVVLVVIAAIVAVRQQREYTRWAAEHTLLVLDDGLAFRDGQVQLKVPFDVVQKLAIKRRNSRVLSIVLKYEGHRKILWGYDDIQGLAQLMVEKVSPEKVSTFSWFCA